MLLPSALPCDAAYSSQPRLQPSLFSPPASPPARYSQTPFNNIMTTCRSLQSLLASSTPMPSTSHSNPMPSLAQLPTPPLAHAPPPLKLRLRPRTNRCDPCTPQRVSKRAAPRGTNKRRRASDDSPTRHSYDADMQEAMGSDSETDSFVSPPEYNVPTAPATPKRVRIAPEQMPLGLERSDFHNMHLDQSEDDLNHINSSHDDDDEEWSSEDDRVLIELVLEKLRLSKTQWQECARGLGRDRNAVNRRWKSLLVNGDVGLKSRPTRRSKRLSNW